MQSRFLVARKNTSGISTTTTATTITSSLVTSTRTGYLLSSYYSKSQFPHHQVAVTYRVKSDFLSKVQSSYLKKLAAQNQQQQETSSELLQEGEGNGKVVEWPWYGGAPPAVEDIASSTSNNNSKDKFDTSFLSQPKGRKYVPLQYVFDIEMRADHLVKAGHFQDALKHYGVCAKARQTAYPEGHLEITKILIKLSRAFRLAGKPQSAVANLERCIQDLQTSASSSSSSPPPPCEQICEIFLELALAQRDLKSDEAGTLFEDVATIANYYHDFGGSHRHLRLNTRKHKALNLNFHNRFVHFSPSDLDRTYSLVNLALLEAEDWYSKTKNDDAGVERVLQTRSNIMDKKYFNMVYQPGRVRTWRGQNKKKRRFNTSNPTATELLAFSPTVHQVYHDYTRANIAPLGREDEVQMAVGARHLDDGDPFRHLRAEAKGRNERQQAAMEFLEKRDEKIVAANSYAGSEAVQEQLRN